MNLAGQPTPHCSDCRWLARSEGNNFGECRRHPPIFVYLPIEGSQTARWPVVVDVKHAYCGEWERA